MSVRRRYAPSLAKSEVPPNQALFVAIMSYNGGINFGLLADYDSMDDVDVIASGIETAIAELVDAAATAAEQEVEAESAARQ